MAGVMWDKRVAGKVKDLQIGRGTAKVFGLEKEALTKRQEAKLSLGKN